MQIQGGRMLIPQEVILSANEQLGPTGVPGLSFDKWQDDKNEGPPRPRIGDVLSIHLAQQPNSTAVWELVVYVQIAQGWFQLGLSILTNPPFPVAAGDPPARTVGFANCPGAIGWKVLCTCSTPGENADIVIQSSNSGGGAVFGVTPNIIVPPA